MLTHLNLHITGKVQGVFYRDSTRRKAQELGITGFVRNQPDGSVYAEAEGTEEQLNQLVGWCHVGPERAQVSQVIVATGPVVGYKGFEIRR
jgi:acylphosphatase